MLASAPEADVRHDCLLALGWAGANQAGARRGWRDAAPGPPQPLAAGRGKSRRKCYTAALEEGRDLLLPWGASEIVANLYVGDLQDAVKFDGVIISVLADVPACEPRRSIQLPFLANGRATLDSTAALIDAALELKLRVLVHCEEGSERAPLVVAWYLVTRRSMSLDEAYSLLRARRP